MVDAHGHAGAAACSDIAAFISGASFASLPADVVAQAQRCLLDLIGVAAAGSSTAAAAMMNRHAASEFGSTEHTARLLFDGRRASRAGAALAGATTIDAFDAHDGHVLTKGHAGVAVLPALLAYADADPRREFDGGECVLCLVLGYEIATRAGMALHATVSDYHCSGAWNALACAAIGARWLGLDGDRTRHALGIAEYFGPRGQILRVCASPTMLKDGSGWGAHAGVTAALLAQQGFTGAPALTVEGEPTRALWSDLGTRWRIREQYMKAYPVCRWAQPAIEAALALTGSHGFCAEEIVALRIESFREAIDLGSQCRYPANTEEAQYSLSYPVAAALVFGRVGAEEVGAARMADAGVKRLCEAMTLAEDAAFSAAFPQERWARLRVTLRDGRVVVSEPHRARGGPENPLSDVALRGKYRALAEPVLGPDRASRIEALVDALPSGPGLLPSLLDALLTPCCGKSTVESLAIA